MMNKVLIVSRTRMHDNKVCVGGIDLTNHRSIRLLDKNGKHEDIINCPYEIFEIWQISYIDNHRRDTPHTEDVNVINRKYELERISSNQLDQYLKNSNVPYFQGTLIENFGGKLHFQEKGRLFIGHDDVPLYSTCFWKCDRNLNLDKFGSYAYCDGTFKWGYKIKYVGVEEAIRVIPKDTIVRLSLANWWSPDDSDDPERCYLQLSGWYK